MNVTGVIIIHNDSEMLRHALASAKRYVDRLVVVDGAYEWAAPFCRLNGEDPERSTDDLKGVLENCGIPYDYICGTWRNETEKRTASIEAAQAERIMRIDADEIYQIDEVELERFWLSDSALGSLHAPLFLAPDVVLGSATADKLSLAPIFFNLKNASVSDILNGLWLVRPHGEKQEVVRRAKIYPSPLGVFYHLSPMRAADSSYRRARFYCLVSMRIAGSVGFGANRKFSNDEEFLDILSGLDQDAVDCAFRLHRISSSFPEIKAGQRLIEYMVGDAPHRESLNVVYQEMMESQRKKCRAFLGEKNNYFSGRPCFLDVTGAWEAGARSFRIECAVSPACDIKLHLDYGLYRETVQGSREVHMPNQLGAAQKLRRIVAEYSVRSPVGYVESVSVNGI